MASEVDICNLALSHLGDSATVASIDPPEGSAQAEHCARFYPIALAALQEMHAWGFCTKRTLLAQVDNPSSTWQYAYALPSNLINILSVLDSAATDDYSATSQQAAQAQGLTYPLNNLMGGYTPQDFSTETNDAGDDILLTNQADAVLRHTILVTDTSKFSPLFVVGFSHLLASHLAGPVLKGELGRAENKAQLALFDAWFKKASASDAGQRRSIPYQQVGWMNVR